jgi:hypothetical protein
MKYILMFFSPFLYFFFRLSHKAAGLPLSLPEPRPKDDDVIFLDDEDDTQPFIRLPFYNREEDDVTGKFERASIFP